MRSFVLQDWTTIRAAASATISQPEAGWLDLEPFQDIVGWIQIAEATNVPTLGLQTSPTADDWLFQTMIAHSVSAGGSPAVVPVLLLNATVPLARFVRWQFSTGLAGDATFRIMVAANAPASHAAAHRRA